jgi:hypothetical protein
MAEQTRRAHRLSKTPKPPHTSEKAWFRRRYGAHPSHLLLLVIAAAVAGWAVLQWVKAPTPVRLLVWFGAALIGHDLVAFPVYTALDRLLLRVIGGRGVFDAAATISRWRRAAINHVRVPALLSILLLVMWYPLIFKRSNGVYFAASGQHQSRFLGNYLLAVGLLFGASLISFVLRLGLAAGRSRNDSSPPRTSPSASTEAPDEPESNRP